MSETPRTDAAELAEEGEDCVDYAVQHLANLARQLERELSAAYAEATKRTAKRCVEICNHADKSTHPADLADAIAKEFDL